MLLYPSLCSPSEWSTCFLYTLVVTSSLSLSLSWTNFVLPLLLRSLSVTPLSRSLYLCFFSLFFIFSLPSICCRVHLFLMPLGFFHLAAFIFYPFIFPHVHPAVCVLLWFGSILMFPVTTAVFRAVGYQLSQLGCRVACFLAWFTKHTSHTLAFCCHAVYHAYDNVLSRLILLRCTENSPMLCIFYAELWLLYLMSSTLTVTAKINAELTR